MYNSVLDAVRELRRDKDLVINRSNVSRYRVVLHEPDQAQTAYYFSAPIYDARTRTLAPLRFQAGKGCYTLQGTNGTVSVLENTICLISAYDRICCTFEGGKLSLSDRILTGEGVAIHPTLNGAVVKIRCGKEGTTVRIRTEKPYFNIRVNSKCFALMQEPFLPVMTLSGIGAFLADGKLCGGIKMAFQKISEREFSVWFCNSSGTERYIWFEVNLYEPKLFLDTTVESGNPEENNVYGSTAFLGSTRSFGTQWLYTRPDYTILADILGREIERVLFYVPMYCGGDVKLSWVTLPRRFCSFGSTWENKVGFDNCFYESTANGRYHILDLTGTLVNSETHMLELPEGWVLRAMHGRYTAVSTGDSSFYPQILSVRFR